METQTQATSADHQSSQVTGEFSPGASVIYSMHGKCHVLAIETRNLGSESIRFYKLEIQKSPLSRSTRLEPAIWVPVANAQERGMRYPLTREAVESVFQILANREYYFQPSESWTSVLPKLEACVRQEGAIGLAKVASYLFVLKKRQVVPSPEILKMNESVLRLMVRELADALNEQPRPLEEKIVRSMRHKLAPDA